VRDVRLPPTHPITLSLDGAPIVAQRGEPVAAAIVGAGHVNIARSPKFHRPRGPACMRGACDGCLARVNDVPNVMTCLTPAEDGMRVVTQNRLGSRDADLLRMTDWFFPDGMNHHELFAGVPGVQSVMQAFARRVAGLGKMPTSALPPRAAVRRDVAALVVGSGPSGMAIAIELAKRGVRPEIVDDALAPGGSLAALPGAAAAPWDELRRTFDAELRRGRARLRTHTTAAAIYKTDVLVADPEGVEIVSPRVLVLACGAHDGVAAFEGNDLPGVMSARAASLLLARGVLPGRRVAIVVTPGAGPFGAAFAAELDAHGEAFGVGKKRPEVHLLEGELLRAKGSSRVSAAIVRTADGERTVRCDALLVDAPRAPAYELAAQAGAALRHEPRGYAVVTDGGRVRPGVYAVGELTGTPLEAGAIARDAARALASIVADVDALQSSTSAPNSASPNASATTSNAPNKTK
jgi:sarcosine oxidase, subunit alpha